MCWRILPVWSGCIGKTERVLCISALKLCTCVLVTPFWTSAISHNLWRFHLGNTFILEWQVSRDSIHIGTDFHHTKSINILTGWLFWIAKIKTSIAMFTLTRNRSDNHIIRSDYQIQITNLAWNIFIPTPTTSEGHLSFQIFAVIYISDSSTVSLSVEVLPNYFDVELGLN